MRLFDLSNTRAMQSYQLMRAGAGIFTGIFLAKSALSTADIGIWESLLFLGTLVIFTGVNGFLQGITPVFTPLDTLKRRQFLFQVFVLFFLVGLFLFVFFSVAGVFIIPAFTGLSDLPGYYWFALYLWLNMSSLPVEILYLLQNRPYAIVWWGILGFGGQLIAVCLPVFMGFGIVTGVQCLCLLALLKLIWTLFLVFRHLSIAFKGSEMRQYIRLSAPLALNSFTGNLMHLYDGWLVGYWFANPAIFALYRYGSREFPWASALSTALGTAAVPGISAHCSTGLNDLKQRSTRLLHAVMPATILLVALTPWLFPIVFNPSFQPSAGLFQIYLLVTLSRVLLPNSVLIGLGDTKIIFYTGLGELVIKLTTGWLFIQWWGLPGLAWSVVVSFWFEKLALGFYLWKYKGIAPSAWLPVRWYGIYALLLLVVFGVSWWIG